MARLYTGAEAPDLTKVEGYPLPISKGGTGASGLETDSSSWGDVSLIVGKSINSEKLYTRTAKNLKDYILKGVSAGGEQPTAHEITSDMSDEQIKREIFNMLDAKIKKPYVSATIAKRTQGSENSETLVAAFYQSMRYDFYRAVFIDSDRVMPMMWSGQSGSWTAQEYTWGSTEGYTIDNVYDHFRGTTLYYIDVDDHFVSN